MLDFCRRLQMLHLRVGEHLVHAVDRAARHAGAIQLFHPVRGRIGFERLVEHRVQLGPVLCPFLEAVEFGRLEEVLAPDCFAEARPHAFARGGNVDIAVGGGIRRGRHAGRMVVADLRRHLPLHEEAGGLEIHERDARLQERALHPLAFPGALALKERSHHAERREKAGRDIGDRGPGAHRTLTRRPGDRHEPAHALRDLVEPGPIAVRTVLAEARDAREDDARVQLFERLVIDPEAVLDVGAVILDHDIGGLHEPHEHFARFRKLEIERHCPLVAVQVLHVRPMAGAAHAFVRIHPGRGLDLDDVGAEVGELLDAGGACAHSGEVEDPKAR
jgi:hypothetical protein